MDPVADEASPADTSPAVAGSPNGAASPQEQATAGPHSDLSNTTPGSPKAPTSPTAAPSDRRSPTAVVGADGTSSSPPPAAHTPEHAAPLAAEESNENSPAAAVSADRTSSSPPPAADTPGLAAPLDTQGQDTAEQASPPAPPGHVDLAQAQTGKALEHDAAMAPAKGPAKEADSAQSQLVKAPERDVAVTPAKEETEDAETKESVEEAKAAAALVAEQTRRMAKLTMAPESAGDRQKRLKVVQADPNSHLSSAVLFEEVPELRRNDALLRGIKGMNFARPSAIQEAALPLMFKDPTENLIAQAQSGSGKTVAFVLGTLHRVDTSIDCLQAIVLTPTRELAMQTRDTFMPLARFMQPPLSVFMALSGNNIARGARVVDHVAIGTPAKIEALLKMRAWSTRDIRVLVLDEADQMLSGTFRDNVVRLMRGMNHPHQNLLFSATFPPEVLSFAEKYIGKPMNMITLISNEELVLDEILQLWIDFRKTRKSRMQVLEDIYEVLELGQSIVFCPTKWEANEISDKLQSMGFSCSVLHGEVDGWERDARMQQFREGQNKVLISTNVLARGLDVPAVSLVVNYSLPALYSKDRADTETYLHRIGRTGRFGRKGTAISFVEDDHAFDLLQEIEMHYWKRTGAIQEVEPDVEAIERAIAEWAQKTALAEMEGS